MIDAVCPNPACGRSLRIHERFLGKKVACVYCKQPFQVDVVGPDAPAGRGSDATTTPGLPGWDVYSEATMAGPPPGGTTASHNVFEDATVAGPSPPRAPAPRGNSDPRPQLPRVAESGPPPRSPRPVSVGAGIKIAPLVVSLISVAIIAGSLAGIVNVLRPPTSNPAAPAADASPPERWAAITIESRGVRIIIADVTRTPNGVDQPYEFAPVQTGDREWSLGKLPTPLPDKAPESLTELEAVLTKLNEQFVANNVPPEHRLVACNGGVLNVTKDTDQIKKLREWIAAAVRKSTDRDLEIVDEAQEAEYGARGSIMHKFRLRSVCLDIGNGATKYGYFYGDGIPIFRGKKFDYGVARGVTDIGARVKKIKPFPTAAREWGKEVVEPEVVTLAKDHAQLTNCHRYYLLGGTAWAVSVLTHPERFESAPDARAEDVLIETKPESSDIDRFLDLLSSKENLPAVAAAVAAGRPGNNPHLVDELDRVCRAFTSEKLIAGGTVLKSFAGGCQFGTKEVRFFTRSLHAWPLGYILVKGNFDR